MTGSIGRETLAKLACALAGALWGLFWFPLRWLAEAGVEGPWIGVVFFAVQTLCLLPFVLSGWRDMWAARNGLTLTTFLAGSALAMYSLGVIYTDVIRAMLLFYLTPLWSTLLARAVLGEPITGMRWLAIALALAGMLVIFGADVGLPWPRNVGDWMGLASGVLWAFAAVRLNQDHASQPAHITFGFLTWGLLICLATVVLPLPGAHSAPSPGAVAGTLYWLVPLVALLAVPGAYAAMWGTRLIDPGIVGILFMTEIIVGTITVAIWAGEPFGLRELLGVVLITAAGLLESVWVLVKGRPRSGVAQKRGPGSP